WAVVHASMIGLILAGEGSLELAGLIGGWIMALKFSGVITAIPIGCFILSRKSSRSALGCFFGLAMVLPGWIRNFLVHGQPWYPIFWSALPTFESRAAL